MQLVPRAYQLSIYNSIMQHGNTLVVLPTGLGKTLIALMLIQDKMKLGRCLFLTPTKPLAKQHYHSVMKTLELSEKNVSLISGEVAPKKRKEMYQTDIIISTPQTIKNDIENSVLLPEFSLVIFDECHRSIGNYAYTYVSEKLHEHSKGNCLFVGLTASPGGRMDRIKEVMDTLKIDNVEIRDQSDPDVSPYVQKSVVSWIPVELSEHFKDIRKELNGLTSKYAQRLSGMGFPPPLKHKGKFMALRQRILDIPHNIKYPALIQYSVLLHLLHMTELLETQGIYPLRGYLEKLKEKESKSAKLLLDEPSLGVVKKLCEKEEDHPKMKVLVDLIKKLGSKIIVFVQYRSQISRIEDVLKQNGISAKQFVGKKDGVTKKIQEETIAEFREGKFDVMVASSVHPNEYIIIRNDKTKEIKLEKIGEFVDKYIKEDVAGTASKQIDGFSTLSYDEDKVDFFTVTHVHKHERISKVVHAKTRSGFNALITEDHSLFSFNRTGRIIPVKPQKNKFIKIALSAPNSFLNKKIDVVKELANIENKEVSEKVFCIVEGMSQAKMRIYTTNRKILSIIKNAKFSVSDVTRTSTLNESTIINTYKRLQKEIKIKKIGRKTFLSITKEGKRYLEFLDWFFSNCAYKKQKYRIPLNSVAASSIPLEKYCEISVGVIYGKTKLPRYISITPPLAEFLGYYVSEGHAKKTTKTGEIFLAAQVKEMQKRMKESVELGLGLKVSVTKNGVGIHSQLAYLLIKYVFRCGIGAYHKEVPNCIFTANPQCKWRFIEGYTRGDGHLAADRICLVSVSRKLICGLIFLLRQLRIKKISLVKSKYRTPYCLYISESFPFHKLTPNHGNRAYYNVVPAALYSKTIFDRFSNTYLEKNSERMRLKLKRKINERSCFDYIKSLEILEEQPQHVYDISVKGTERFFGGPGLICLHNSIGEEGLDIPAVDTVIFYEPVPSEIRSIQRRGRAARLKEGQVIVLMTMGTRDEYYYYASTNREKKMKKILTGMQKAKKSGFDTAEKKSKEDKGCGDVPRDKPKQTKMTEF